MIPDIRFNVRCVTGFQTDQKADTAVAAIDPRPVLMLSDFLTEVNFKLDGLPSPYHGTIRTLRTQGPLIDGEIFSRSFKNEPDIVRLKLPKTVIYVIDNGTQTAISELTCKTLEVAELIGSTCVTLPFFRPRPDSYASHGFMHDNEVFESMANGLLRFAMNFRRKSVQTVIVVVPPNSIENAEAKCATFEQDFEARLAKQIAER